MRMINIEASQNLPWVKDRSFTFQQHPANNPSLAGTLHLRLMTLTSQSMSTIRYGATGLVSYNDLRQPMAMISQILPAAQ